MSAVQKGRRFELAVVELLSRYRFVVEHTGGSNDRGVDFRGYWRPSERISLPVIGQCKAYSRRLRPCEVREMEGTARLHSAPPTLALLVSSNGFSVGSTSLLRSLTSPIALATISLNDASANLVELSLSPKAQALLPWLFIGSDYKFNNHRKTVSLLLKKKNGQLIDIRDTTLLSDPPLRHL
ncbi:uncharacterized protein [Oscarella lobularis]|uniref:uncharacterized protein n=1 Tax=Oscarella lobularis TaxID=121494 RepID=UPI00331352BC